MNTIISIILLLSMIVFAVLKSVWTGFVFFALGALVLLCLYWLYVLIVWYVEEYKESFEENYKLYCAKLINTTNIKSEDLSSNEGYYKKKFKRSLIKDKLIEFAKMLFLITIIVLVIVVIASGRIK